MSRKALKISSKTEKKVSRWFYYYPWLQINNFHTLSGMVNTVTRSNTSSALDQELENKRKVELALK